VFAWLAKEYVPGWVIVTWIFGCSKYVLAITADDVGHNGAVFVAVIDEPGKDCIGAYRIGPVCIVYGTANLSPTTSADAAARPARGMAAGPAVPVTVKRPIETAGLDHEPVIPVKVNRLE